MDRTPEGADAVHRVKPGRKPKVMEVFPPVVAVTAREVNRMHMDNLVTSEPIQSQSQTYARRIWDGQSVDLPIAERLTRVIMGLNGQKMDIPDLTFLHPDATRLLYTPRTK